MDQNNNNSQNEFLWTLLANPANDAHLYAYNLQQLVNDFPQSGILQALLAHASDEKNLRQASVYFNAKLLYKLINAPSTINSVPDEKIIIHAPVSTNGYSQHIEHSQTDESLVAGQEENISDSIGETHFDSDAVIETEAETAVDTAGHEPEIEHEDQTLDTIITDQDQLTETIDEETPHPTLSKGEGSEEGTLSESDQEVLSFGEDLGEATPPIAEEVTDHKPEIEWEEDQPSNTIITYGYDLTETIDEAEESVAVEDPVENEAVGAQETVFSDTELAQPEPELADGAAEIEAPTYTGIESHIKEATPPVAEEPVVEPIEQQAEKHIADDETFNEIVGIEDISIQPAASAQEQETITDAKPASEAVEEENLVEENIASTDQHDVSKYNDEKMPYTFMWWLDKTRKEHIGVYQPYINSSSVNSNVKTKMAADELQQQYFENIFHITSIGELDKGAAAHTVPFDMKRKENVIIERFIKEEPQIKPQSSDKLDNENKAKKSSEDRDELVTETLAGIYSEQMLYHKAIASYKKLMLKFPEKSRYFAAKIEQLEKKIN